ncbi:MAG: SseB family protein, partial [Candidatus Nanopelagicales bacterium]
MTAPGPGHGAGEQHRPGEPRFGGMGIPEPEFADDDGVPDPVLADVLARHALGEARLSDVIRALHGKRLMAPLMAVLDSVMDGVEAGAPGPGEKDSHMATVSLVSPDGRRGLLAFTSVRAMAAWEPAARGIPASAARVAAAAIEEGADALL